MQNTKKPRRVLPLHTETLRQLSTVELDEIVGGVPPRTFPCSIPCTTLCSSGL